MTYTSHAHRENGWWVVQNDQYPGAISQVRRLERAAEVQREAIAFVAGVSAATVDVAVRAELRGALGDQLHEAASLRTHAAAMESRALELRRSVARALADDGMTVRDIGAVIGISYQRAHQLLGESTAAPSPV
jgi:hypothetical protein